MTRTETRTNHRKTGRAIAVLAIALSSLTARAQAQGQGEAFDVYEYRVLDNSVLPVDVVERAVYPYLGPNKTIEDVQSARSALELAYRSAGYSTVYVDLPEQSVDSAIVRFKVTEGRLDRIRVTGSRYFSNGAIREKLPSVQPGVVPKFEDVQRELMALNQATADRAVTPVVRAGRAPGTVDMDLKVSDKLPVHGSLRVDDRYTADTSRTRAAVNLSYSNLWQKFHTLSLQYQTAPEERTEARVLAATYIAPLSRPGAAIAAYVVDTNSDVASVNALGPVSVLGAGRIYGMRWIQPIMQGDGFSHGLSFGIDYKDFSESLQLDPTTGQETPISYSTLSMGYNGALRGERSASTFDLSVNFGIRGLGNTEAEFENKRFKGRPNFFYVRAGAGHEHKLFGPLSVATDLAGQYAVEPLVSNEQFSIGGAESVRGYLEADSLGDYGLSGSFELRSSLAPAWLRESGGAFYGLMFFDAGAVVILDPLESQTRTTDLRSWGAGLRLAGFHGVSAALDWANPLVSSQNTESGDSRVHFSVQYGF